MSTLNLHKILNEAVAVLAEDEASDMQDQAHMYRNDPTSPHQALQKIYDDIPAPTPAPTDAEILAALRQREMDNSYSRTPAEQLAADAQRERENQYGSGDPSLTTKALGYGKAYATDAVDWVRENPGTAAMYAAPGAILAGAGALALRRRNAAARKNA